MSKQIMTIKPIISIITSIYNGEPYLEKYIDSVKKQTIFDGCELIFVLNDGTLKEKEILENFQFSFSDKIIILSISPKECLSASWNRGVQIAKGDFLAFWNVDDFRTPNSLEKQIKTLKNNPDIVMAYGDFFEIQNINDCVGLQSITPEFKKEIFLKRFASGGAFLVFRSYIFSQCGYFDEQLEISADYDFVLRLVNMNFKFKKTCGTMGYFINNKLGLSTQINNQKLEIEQNIIFRRYRIFDKIKWEYRNISEINNYSNFLFFSKYFPISQYGLSDLEKEFDSLDQKILFWGKNTIRFFLKIIGVWKISMKLRDFIFGFKRKINNLPKTK